eukprot:3426551-Amphidinium_carterae.1
MVNHTQPSKYTPALKLGPRGCCYLLFRPLTSTEGAASLMDVIDLPVAELRKLPLVHAWRSIWASIPRHCQDSCNSCRYSPNPTTCHEPEFQSSLKVKFLPSCGLS